MLSNIGRAAIKRIGGSNLSTNRFLATIWQLQRVEGQQNAESSLNAPSASFLARRLYATATKATQTKPTTAKKPATKKAPAKAPAAKKPAAKKPAAKKPAKKAAKKPVKKPVKKKVKAKAKPKPKKKKAVALTDSQKLRIRLKELKVTGLIKEEPTEKAQTAYFVLCREVLATNNKVSEAAKEASEKYKSASTEELERLNRIANENKTANIVAYKKWVESHTADEIRLANLARKQIRRLTNKNATPRLIKDDRAVRSPSPPMVFFLQERYQSGDFNGIKSQDAMKRIAQEFKELSAEQRKPYETTAAADVARYFQEYKTVYKHDPVTVRNAQAKA